MAIAAHTQTSQPETTIPALAQTDSSRRVPELDGLRGLAILLVLLFHYIGNSRTGLPGSALYRFSNLFRLGWSGVDLFFVLSGFLIGGILLSAKSSPKYFQTFYIRRVHRIIPIYYLWVVLYMVAFLWVSRRTPSTLPVSGLSIGLLPLYFVFLQNFLSIPLGTLGWYWLSVAWSLAVEEQFYLVAPPLIRFLSLRRLVTVLVSAVVLAPFLRLLVFETWHNHPGGAYYVLMPCRADALAIGMLAAIAWRTPASRDWLFLHKRGVYLAFAILFCGLPVFLKWFPGPLSLSSLLVEYTWLALFYVCLMLIALMSRSGIVARLSRWKLLMELGCLSYCMYLIHLLVNGACHAVLLNSSPRINDLPGVATTLLAAALTFAIAKVSWIYFEKPLIRRGHAYEYWPKIEPAPAPARQEGEVLA